MKRIDNRENDCMRKVNIIEDYVSCADASVLIEIGRTRVLCNATIENKIPKWKKEKGAGWITAEYNLLPRSTQQRVRRERGMVSGRTQEIQRLIGRSLRAACDLSRLGEKTITIDCDVLEADGGTRTTSITGGFIALVKAVRKIKNGKNTTEPIFKHWISSTSVGVVNDKALLDLSYHEDFDAQVDMNVVMTETAEFIEIQSTGEKTVFSRKMLNNLLDLAAKGCAELIEIQKKILGDSLP